MPDKSRRIKTAPAPAASCLLLTTFGLLLTGCAGDRRVAAGDPLLGGAAPGVVNPQAAAPPPANPTPVASAPNLAAPNVPPLPPINPTASNAALASGGSQPLDGGRDFRFRVSGDVVNIQQGMVLQGLTTADWDAKLPGFGTHMRRVYHRAMRRRAPVAYSGLYLRAADQHTCSHESLMAPLGDDGETVDHLIVVSAV